MALKTFQFMAENADGWYKRLNVEEKQKIETSVNRMNQAVNYVRMNGLPDSYKKAGEKIAKRLNVNPSSITDEAVFAIDNMISRTVEDQAIFPQVMASITTPMNGLKWTSKAYKIDEKDVNSAKQWPKPDKTFREPNMFTIGIEPEGFQGMGFSFGYEIPWTDIAASAGSIYSPDYYYSLIAAERMGIIIDENGWLGGAGEHMGYDFGYKGLINHASIQSFTTSTPSTYGNLRAGLWNALGDLKLNFQAGKVIGVCTSGYASQFFYNRFAGTSDQSEYFNTVQELKNQISEMWIDDRIYGAAASASAQVCALFKVGPTLMTNKVVLPLQSKPMLNKTYGDDIKEALIYGNVFGIYGNSPFPVTVCSTMTTTDTGYLPNGRLW
jgi:hypothetical protein